MVFVNVWNLCQFGKKWYFVNRFSVKCRFPFNFAFFTVKSPNVTQRSVSQDNAFKRSKHPSPFFPKL